ncbi:MAG: hypothetical protein IJZ53_12800 [Tyzzerella sp.]|nr:hypothetical protein [Tyzzerella sp.]
MKKKSIMISSITALFIIGIVIVAITTYNNQKNKEKQEATKIKQEMEAQQDLDQGAELNLDRGEQSSQDKWEDAWAAMNENQECLTLGSTHLKRISEGGGVRYEYSVEFIDSLYLINDGWFQGVSKEDLGSILAVALSDLPDNATGKEVYDALCDYSEVVNRSAAVTGEGTDVLQGLIEFEPEPTQPQQQTNQSSSNKNNNNSSSSNKNNSSSNNQSSTPPADNSDEGSGSSSGFGSADGWEVGKVEGNPEDNQGEEIPGFEIHN